VPWWHRVLRTLGRTHLGVIASYTVIAFGVMQFATLVVPSSGCPSDHHLYDRARIVACCRQRCSRAISSAILGGAGTATGAWPGSACYWSAMFVT
jgi:hypothetical protein